MLTLIALGACAGAGTLLRRGCSPFLAAVVLMVSIVTSTAAVHAQELSFAAMAPRSPAAPIASPSDGFWIAKSEADRILTQYEPLPELDFSAMRSQPVAVAELPALSFAAMSPRPAVKAPAPPPVIPVATSPPAASGCVWTPSGWQCSTSAKPRGLLRRRRDR